jgi:hypothetical protein
MQAQEIPVEGKTNIDVKMVDESVGTVNSAKYSLNMLFVIISMVSH